MSLLQRSMPEIRTSCPSADVEGGPISRIDLLLLVRTKVKCWTLRPSIVCCRLWIFLTCPELFCLKGCCANRDFRVRMLNGGNELAKFLQQGGSPSPFCRVSRGARVETARGAVGRLEGEVAEPGVQMVAAGRQSLRRPKLRWRLRPTT